MKIFCKVQTKKQRKWKDQTIIRKQKLRKRNQRYGRKHTIYRVMIKRQGKRKDKKRNGNLSPDPMPLFFWLYRCSQSDKLLAEASNYRYHCRFLCAGSFVSISHKDKCSIGHGLFALQILDCRAIPQFADRLNPVPVRAEYSRLLSPAGFASREINL